MKPHHKINESPSPPKIRIWILVLSALLLSVAAYVWSHRKPTVTSAVTAAASQDAALKQLLEANRKTLVPFLLALTARIEAPPREDKAELERQRAQTLKESFQKMHDVGRMINRDALRNEIMDILLTKEGYLQMATNLAADFEYAQSLFGKDQALSRVMSIRILTRAAERGNIASLSNAIERVGERMNASEKWEKGIQHDYISMIASYVDVYGVDNFLANPQPLFKIVGLTEQTALEVEKGLFDSKLRSVPAPVWREKLGHYFAAVRPQPTAPRND